MQNVTWDFEVAPPSPAEGHARRQPNPFYRGGKQNVRSLGSFAGITATSNPTSTRVRPYGGQNSVSPFLSATATPNAHSLVRTGGQQQEQIGKKCATTGNLVALSSRDGKQEKEQKLTFFDLKRRSADSQQLNGGQLMRRSVSAHGSLAEMSSRGPEKKQEPDKGGFFGFKSRGADSQEKQSRSNSIGFSFPTREELSAARDSKQTVPTFKAAIQPSTEEHRIKRRSTMSFMTSHTPSVQSNPSSSGVERNANSAECLPSQNIHRAGSYGYLSQVEYYQPKLQVNKISAIQQGCYSSGDMKDLATRERKVKAKETYMYDHFDLKRPTATSTLSYIMNSSQTRLAADLYANMDLRHAHGINRCELWAADECERDHTDVFAQMNARRIRAST